MKYPSLRELRLGLPTAAQFRDGLIRLLPRGDACANGVSRLNRQCHVRNLHRCKSGTESGDGLTQRPQAAARLPQAVILFAAWFSRIVAGVPTK
ncbi:MAG: hypothetical protein M3O33_06310 [Cyanobacteriota bacterium]|nr:hypothetical protein [Cyanobacteriota bacterium]